VCILLECECGCGCTGECKCFMGILSASFCVMVMVMGAGCKVASADIVGQKYYNTFKTYRLLLTILK